MKLATIAASGAAVVMMTPAAGHAAETPGARTLFVNNHSNQCLQIADPSAGNGAPATQGYCENGQKSQWRAERVGTTRDFRIVNVVTGKCLEIADSRKDNGAPAQQWTCVDKLDTQLWAFEFANDNGLIFNKNSAKVLEVENSAIKPGARVQQWSYAGAPGQWWRSVQVPGTATPTPQPSAPSTTAPTPRPTVQPSQPPTAAPQPSKAPSTPQPAATVVVG
ncbi:hypothetical protein GCM10018779_01090 [Streptomyces griseocarneus]|nr:hypothetical protein GCM10018779_01090 [Streptomyces griseocarneus]